MSSMKKNTKEATSASIHELLEIMSRLRNPATGCPWDIKQTHHSLIPCLLEEAHELANAIRFEKDQHLCEELGDVLLQVIFHAHIANEESRFSILDVIEGINKKLIRRHPHIFSKPKKLTMQEAKKSWENIKASESKQSSESISNYLRGKIRCQPALTGAMTISHKAASTGFEWENIKDVIDKVDEEIIELKQAISNQNITDIKSELGDVIFTLVNIARWFNINPEDSLSETNKRFLDRFAYMELALNENISTQSKEDLKQLWQRAKAKVKGQKQLSNSSDNLNL